MTGEGSRHTTIGGFLPLLIFVGGDFWPPLAVVLSGGVGESTLLAMIFVPAAYSIVIGWRVEKTDRSDTARHGKIIPMGVTQAPIPSPTCATCGQ